MDVSLIVAERQVLVVARHTAAVAPIWPLRSHVRHTPSATGDDPSGVRRPPVSMPLARGGAGRPNGRRSTTERPVGYFLNLVDLERWERFLRREDDT